MANEDMGMNAPRRDRRKPRVSARPDAPNDNGARSTNQDEQGEQPTRGQTPTSALPERRRRRPSRPDPTPEPPSPAPGDPPGRRGRSRRPPDPEPERPAIDEAAAAQGQPPAPQEIVPEEVIDEAAPGAPSVPVPPEEALTPPPARSRNGTGEDGQPPAGLEQPSGAAQAPAARRGRRARERGTGGPHSNALGVLIEQRFADPKSPVRSYSELERRSGISREALSRYVTPRPDRRRSPTIDTLAAVADAMRISLEQVARAGVASAQGIALPPEATQEVRAEVVAPLVAMLTDDQFSAVVELLRQMQPRAYPGSEPE